MDTMKLRCMATGHGWWLQQFKPTERPEIRTAYAKSWRVAMRWLEALLK